jgi:hypothetical protein
MELMKTYAHALLGQQQDAAARLGRSSMANTAANGSPSSLVFSRTVSFPRAVKT